MADAPNPDAWRSTIRRRILVVAVIFAAWAVGIEARLVYLQVYRHDDYVTKAERQQVRTLTVPAIRGDILDRDNRVLATSADVETDLRGAERDRRHAGHRDGAVQGARRLHHRLPGVDWWKGCRSRGRSST